MREWPLVNWVWFCGLFMIKLAYIIALGYYYTLASVQFYYLGLAVLIMASFAIPALLLRKTHVLHIHHYNVGMVFVILIAYQNVVFAILSGIANGWLIEGVTVYAYDPVFKPKIAKVEKAMK